MKTTTLESGITIVDPRQARLMATNSQKELLSTSITLSVLTAVQEYAESLLRPLGATFNKSSRIKCFVEPTFEHKKLKDCRMRPDGLIEVSYGKKTWVALVEAKTGGNNIDAGQIENYLDLARTIGAQCVITISNQFVCDPSHPVVKLNKQKMRSVDSFHWSWSFLQAEAKIQIGQSAVDDEDQVYILKEYVRFLDDDRSGVEKFKQMSSEWSDSVKRLNRGEEIPKDSVADSMVNDWNELARSCSLQLSEALRQNVTIHLTKSERDKPLDRMKADVDLLLANSELCTTLKVPDAAGLIDVKAHLIARTLQVSMSLKAPTDKSRPTACVNWLTRQLKQCENPEEIRIRAKWPGRTKDTNATLAEALAEPECLTEMAPRGDLPKSFTVLLHKDMKQAFAQRQKLPVEVEKAILEFYEYAAQNLRAWVAPAPKVNSAPIVIDDESND